MQARIKLSSRLLLLLFFLLLVTLKQVNASEHISQDAQEALRRGLLAAQQEEWNIAIRYFNEAHRNAPAAPEILFNLGLAESKLPGRELRSIAWFNAYLAAAPKAPNAGLVQEQIKALEVKVEATIDKLIRQARQMAQHHTNDTERWYSLQYVAEALAEAGDISGAKDLAESSVYKAETLSRIAVIQARDGDVDGASWTASRIAVNYTKSRVYMMIAITLARAGNIAGAQATLNYITQDEDKHPALIAIAMGQHKVDRVKDAHASLVNARDHITQVRNPPYKDWKNPHYMDVFRAQLLSGDIDGGRETAALLSGVYRESANEDIQRFQHGVYQPYQKDRAEFGFKGGLLFPTLDTQEFYNIKEIGAENLQTWQGILNKHLGGSMYTDLQGYLQSLSKEKEPGKMIKNITQAARVMAVVLKKFKRLQKGN